MPLTLKMSNEEKIKVTCSPKTLGGNPAELDSPLSGRVVSGASVTVEEDQNDPMSIWLISTDTPGDTTVVVEADADLGEGIVLIQDAVTTTVTSPMAANLGITASPPELK